MKKNLITLSILSVMGTASTLAVAATNVELYGTVNVAFEKRGDSKITLQPQDYQYASKFGIKGREDLGNGYAAIFRLEAQINPDVGSGTYGSTGTEFGFNRESWVGLITPVGAVRIGRSTTPFVNMWIGGGFGAGRGIGEFTAGLVGAGLRTTKPEVAPRWSNALFYDVKKGGFAAGAAVTTKGSQSLVPQEPGLSSVNNEGTPNTKHAYGAYARYEGDINEKSSFKIGAAYQVDNGGSFSGFPAVYPAVTNDKNAPAEAKKAWAVAAGYKYGAISLSAGYAKADIDNTSLAIVNPPAPGYPAYGHLRSATSKTLFASIKGQLTAKDAVYFSYGNYKRENKLALNPAAFVNGVGNLEGTQYSIGYEHALSKRTVVYLNARKVKVNENSCTPAAGPGLASGTALCAGSVATVNNLLATEKDYSYDIGLSHSF